MRDALPTIRDTAKVSRKARRTAATSERFNYQDEREFQRADRGYHRSFGDRERYRQTFRDGYAAGYSEAFGRYSRVARNDGRYRPTPGRERSIQPAGTVSFTRRLRPWCIYRNGGYYSPAFDNGARDGYEKGQEDARKSRSFDPLRHSWYRSGDRHYDDRIRLQAAVQGHLSSGIPAGVRTGIPRRPIHLVDRPTEGAGISSCAPGRSPGRRQDRRSARPSWRARALRGGSSPPVPPVRARAGSLLRDA